MSLYWVFLLLAVVSADRMGFLLSPDPTLFYTTDQLIKYAGYPFEKYKVITDDGYILSLFRIGSNSTSIMRKPVLMMHGMTAASDSWLLQGPKRDLAYMLYNAGYDVWLGDVRGNYYSRGHVKLLPSDPTFWLYSFHEIGREDLPAFIKTILSITGYDKINYIGHSMGTTSFFIMASEKPEMMDKINFFVALSPVARMDFKNFSPQKANIFEFVDELLNNFERQRYYEILTRVWYAPYLSSVFCANGSLTQSLCYDLIFFWAGSQSHRISKQALSRVLSHAPAGLSVYTPMHYLFIMRTGRFAAMDMGPEINMIRYNSIHPPDYDLSKVTCPVSLFYSEGDFLINATDVRQNMKLMPNVVHTHESKDMNHIDFVWGRTAKREMYYDLVRMMNKYNS